MGVDDGAGEGSGQRPPSGHGASFWGDEATSEPGDVLVGHVVSMPNAAAWAKGAV